MKNCSVSGCLNSKTNSPDKYFFWSPLPADKKELWSKAINKSFNGKFLVCEDHFDLTTDVELYKVSGIPMLKKAAYPHRNLKESDMVLQAKIDSLNWSCFVPNCDSARLMTDKKLIFFPVPEGEQGVLWKSAVNVVQRYLNTSSVDELVFCCEEHFDMHKDIQKIFHCDGSVEFKVNAGVVPSVILSKSKQSHLGDSSPHPKMIRNNHLASIYNSKLLMLIENQKSHVKVENGLDDESCIKSELIDFGYDDECNSRLIIERQEVYCESELMDFGDGDESNSKLLIEKQEVYSEAESGTESESSVESYKERVKDPDVTFDDFASDTDDTITFSDESIIETSDSDEDNSDLDTTERFECPHCQKLVRKLEEHVERTHENYAKKINRTICGLCTKKFPYKGNVKDHQKEVHNGMAYACDLCEFMTTRYQIIKHHVIGIHSDEKYFLCHVCAKAYKYMKDLKRHTGKHSEKRERRYACSMCDKNYMHAHTLRYHINAIHSKEQKFHCKVDGCNKSFLRKCNWSTHQQVHSGNFFSCIICGKKFSFKCNLQTHIKNIHGTT